MVPIILQRKAGCFVYQHGHDKDGFHSLECPNIAVNVYHAVHMDGIPTEYVIYRFCTCFIMVHAIYILYIPRFLLCTVIVNMCKTRHPSTDGLCRAISCKTRGFTDTSGAVVGILP